MNNRQKHRFCFILSFLLLFSLGTPVSANADIQTSSLAPTNTFDIASLRDDVRNEFESILPGWQLIEAPRSYFAENYDSYDYWVPTPDAEPYYSQIPRGKHVFWIAGKQEIIMLRQDLMPDLLQSSVKSILERYQEDILQYALSDADSGQTYCINIKTKTDEVFNAIAADMFDEGLMSGIKVNYNSCALWTFDEYILTYYAADGNFQSERDAITEAGFRYQEIEKSPDTHSFVLKDVDPHDYDAYFSCVFAIYDKTGKEIPTQIYEYEINDNYYFDLRNVISISSYIPAMIRGDLDIDGAVDVTDAVKLLRVLNEDPSVQITNDGMDNADFNGDGNLTMQDFRSLMHYLAGMPE